MSEKNVVVVLPPERKEKGKVPTMVNLQSLAKQIDTDFDEYEKHERAAMIFALRIGVAMVLAKEICEHGEYLKWVHKSVLTIRLTHAYRFRSLAEAFIENQKLERKQMLMLTEAQSDKQDKLRAEQLMFDFIGGRSQAELFKDYGILVRDPKPKGGNNYLTKFLRENYPEHAGKELKELPKEIQIAWKKYLASQEPSPEMALEIEREGSKAAWSIAMGKLCEEALDKKSYIHLSREEMEQYYGLILDVKNELGKALKK